MPEATSFEDVNADKADFSAIYDAPDPRRYFQILGSLGYIIPDLARPVVSALLAAYRETRGVATPRLVDVGCSYGVNAATLKCGLTMAELFNRYTDPGIAELSPEELRARDQRFFASQPASEAVRVIGLDPATNAVAYGTAAGLLDTGIPENLEVDPPSTTAAVNLAAADLVMSTGCVGYVTQQTFRRLVGEMAEDGTPPWVVSFVLRIFPYDAIVDSLARFGLATEVLGARTFIQRRFASADERDAAIARVEERGLDPAGREAAGCFHAQLYLSRPRAEARALPLADIVRLH